MSPRKLLRVGILLAAVSGGCQQPGYRTEVVGNGQGGVQIQRLPADPRAPAPATAAARQSRIDALESQVRQQQQYIEALQRHIQQQDEELRKLKSQPTTAPAP